MLNVTWILGKMHENTQHIVTRNLREKSTTKLENVCINV